MSKVMSEVTSNINKQISSEMEKVLTAFSTSASEQNQKVEELKDVVATVERKVDTKLKIYEKNMKMIEQKNEKRAKDRESISDQVRKEIEKKTGEMQQRIDAMSENVKSLRVDFEKKGSGSGQSGLRSGPDPLMQNDPWARPSSSRTEPPRAEPAQLASRPAPASHTPKALHLKGWSRFQDSRGLNSNDAKALGGRIVGHLPAELQSQIASVRAPYILNYKIVLELAEPSWGLCVKMKEAINNIIEAKNVKAMHSDLNIRCIVAPSPELATRNRLVAKALGTLEKHLTDDQNTLVKTDWKAASVYKIDDPDASYPVHTITGKIKGTEWAWLDEPLGLCFPSVELEPLKSDTAAIMAE